MQMSCPIPQSQFDHIVLGHGGGGRLSQDLLRQVIAEELGSALPLHDLDAGFVSLPQSFQNGAEDLVFTTDSFVVDPIFFPGGDIGTLSVVGTVNDLAMMGAAPVGLSVAFVLEEGFSILDFRRVLKSMARELQSLKLKVLCGDTKVVPRGKGDRIFINTSGIGVRLAPRPWQPRCIEVGDAILVSRDLGRHGTTIMCARHQLGISAELQSDCHELFTLTRALIENGVDVHCARDLTRGGLLSAAVELATTSQKILEIIDSEVPRSKEVQGVCELLGLDVYSIANEGAGVFFVPPAQVDKTLAIMRRFDHARAASVVGSVLNESLPGKCLLKLASGVQRRWSLPPGELLPRIC